MRWERRIRVEVFLVSCDPVSRNVALGRRQIQVAGTHQLMEPFFQIILYKSIPTRCFGWLRPKIVDVFRTSQPGSNQHTR